VASFILSSAGIPYDQPESPPLSEEQAAKVADTEFWSLLTESQKEAFIRMLAPDKETAPNVVSIEAAKVRRRMKAPS
jgi:hypothetical protein